MEAMVSTAREHSCVPSRRVLAARVLDVLSAHLPRGASARILELGCAPGRWLAWAHDTLRVRPLGIELDEYGVQLSHRLYQHVPVARADAFRLPLRSKSFNAVYSIGLVEHFDDPIEIVSEARRVLKPGGVGIWVVPNLVPGSVCRWHWSTFQKSAFEAHRVLSMDDLAEMVSRGGFTVVHQEYNGLYIPHCQRLMGRLPFRRMLRRFESPRLASNLVVVGRATAQ